MQGIPNPNPMSEMENEDLRPGADAGAGRAGWCICQDALSYTEVTSLGGLTQYRFVSGSHVRHCRGWWRALLHTFSQRPRLVKAPSSSEAAIATGAFRAHQRRGETVKKQACSYLSYTSAHCQLANSH